MPTLRQWPAVAAMIAMAAGIAGCDLLESRPLQPDAKWHERALVDGHLAHWLAVAPSETGFLHASVTRAWKPREQKTTDLVTQSRLIYVLLSGYEVTGDTRYLDAARRGADFLLRHFSDPVHGGLFRAVDVDGRVVSDSKHTYGHAFAIFALSHAYRVTRDERYRAAAMATWRAVQANLSDPGGGFRPEAPRDFSVGESGSRTQNPVMHLFEALLALYDATGDPDVLADARSIGDFVVDRLMHGLPDGGAYIAERYDAKWKPLPEDGGGNIELGHQFEWAFLLNSSAERGLPSVYAAVAQRLLDYAIATGYDEQSGGCFNVAYANGKVVRDKGYWQQSECLRTIMRYASLYGKPEMKRRYEQTLSLVQDELIDAANGGWYFMTRSDCTRRSCPDEQPDAYHMTAMHREALALAARANANR
ncbi:MAG TPA: AGE family epimerase/isomerase [Casimicrobiaceae bacterium]|nr:AGE family epimerase/isomerase [Casimicrobiaceae bacterium]